MGWNQRLEDWRTLVELAPAGSFVALDGDRVVGTAIGIDYGHCRLDCDDAGGARVSRPRSRRASARGGDGRAPTGRCRFGSTPRRSAGHFTSGHGFVLETSLTRHVGPPSRRRPRRDRGHASAACRSSGGCPHDAAIFGGVRSRLIEWMVNGSPQYAWVAHDSVGRPQYCLGRAGLKFDQIGPVVAQDPEVAKALVGAAPSARGRKTRRDRRV